MLACDTKKSRLNLCTIDKNGREYPWSAFGFPGQNPGKSENETEKIGNYKAFTNLYLLTEACLFTILKISQPPRGKERRKII